VETTLELTGVPPTGLEERGRAVSLPPVASDFSRLVYCLMGIPVDAVSARQAIRKLQGAVRRQDRCFLSTPNLNFLIASLSDQNFRESVIRSDLSVADGMPLVWMARLLGLPVRERVAGSTLFENIGAADDVKAMRVYFFGGPHGAAALAAEAVNSKSSGMHCVGHASPGFGSIEEMSDPATIDNINQRDPDFLVVALGAKKGQRWIEHNLTVLTARVISHLGAVINMAAGTITRAPLWMQRVGLEWVWRIKEEPALWKRYLGDGAVLTKLLVFNVLPSLYYERIYRRTIADWRATVRLEHSSDTCKVVLDGQWNDSMLSPLREALAEATIQPCHITVDMSGVEYGDSAFIALLIILYGHQLRVRRQYVLTGVTPILRRILRAHCADYLVTM
jgi:N-acetylglucosaminyldiphosphoundecaprenol N-acetyl-beta-D-mannosaminyltransferase